MAITFDGYSWSWNNTSKLLTVNLSTTYAPVTYRNVAIATYRKTDNIQHTVGCDSTYNSSTKKIVLKIYDFQAITDFDELSIVLNYLNQPTQQFYKIVLSRNASNQPVVVSSAPVGLKSITIPITNGYSYDSTSNDRPLMGNFGDPISDANGYSDNFLEFADSSWRVSVGSTLLLNIDAVVDIDATNAYFDGFLTGSGSNLVFNYVSPFDNSESNLSNRMPTTSQSIKKKTFFIPDSTGNDTAWQKIVYTVDSNKNFVLSSNETIDRTIPKTINLHAPTGFIYSGQKLLAERNSHLIFLDEGFSVANGNLLYSYSPTMYHNTLNNWSTVESFQTYSLTESWNTKLRFFGTEFYVLGNFKESDTQLFECQLTPALGDSRYSEYKVYDQSNGPTSAGTYKNNPYGFIIDSNNNLKVNLRPFSGTMTAPYSIQLVLSNNKQSFRLTFDYNYDTSQYETTSTEIIDSIGESQVNKTLALNLPTGYSYSDGTVQVKILDDTHTIYRTLDLNTNNRLTVSSSNVYYNYTSTDSNSSYLKFSVVGATETAITMFKTSPGGYYDLTTDDVEGTGGTGGTDTGEIVLQLINPYVDGSYKAYYSTDLATDTVKKTLTLNSSGNHLTLNNGVLKFNYSEIQSNETHLIIETPSTPKQFSYYHNDGTGKYVRDTNQFQTIDLPGTGPYNDYTITAVFYNKDTKEIVDVNGLSSNQNMPYKSVNGTKYAFTPGSLPDNTIVQFIIPNVGRYSYTTSGTYQLINSIVGNESESTVDHTTSNYLVDENGIAHITLRSGIPMWANFFIAQHDYVGDTVHKNVTNLTTVNSTRTVATIVTKPPKGVFYVNNGTLNKQYKLIDPNPYNAFIQFSGNAIEVIATTPNVMMTDLTAILRLYKVNVVNNKEVIEKTPTVLLIGLQNIMKKSDHSKLPLANWVFKPWGVYDGKTFDSAKYKFVFSGLKFREPYDTQLSDPQESYNYDPNGSLDGFTTGEFYYEYYGS